MFVLAPDNLLVEIRFKIFDKTVSWTDLAEVLYLKLSPAPMVTVVSDSPAPQVASGGKEDNILEHVEVVSGYLELEPLRDRRGQGSRIEESSWLSG